MSEQHIGKVIQITGPVLDIRFKEGELPDLNNAVEISVDGRRRGKDDLVNVMAHHRLEQDLHAVDIVVEILQRLLHALADEGIRREMDDGLDLVLIENLVEHRRVADIALVELRFRVQRPAMAGLEVVDDDDVLAFRHELMNRMGTDVAGTAANEN